MNETADPIINSKFSWIENVPTKWSKMKLRYLVNHGNQGLNTALSPVEYSDMGLPLVKSKNIQHGLDLKNADKISESSFENISDIFKPEKNDILFSNIGNLGTAQLVNQNISFAIAWNVFRIQCNQKCYPKFLTYFLNSIYAKSTVESLSYTNTMAFIPKSALFSILIFFPEWDAQIKLCNFLDNQLEELSNHILFQLILNTVKQITFFFLHEEYFSFLFL